MIPQREQLLQTYQNFEENEFSKIFDNEFFGYTKITIEQPKVENGEVVRDKKGNPKPDSKLRDSERVPLSDDIEEYFNREVEPHLPTHGLILIKVKWDMKSTSPNIFTNTDHFVHQMISLMIY